MRSRPLALTLLFVFAALMTGDAAAQTVRKTPWGDPDLQGVWPGGPVFAVPFERDPELGTRRSLSAEEATRRNEDVDAQSGFVVGNFFPELGHAPPLTSLISDPENGRLPPMTEDGMRRANRWQEISNPEYPAAGPEELRPYDRCISRGVLGSAFPNSYSSGMRIVQGPGFVVILHEMIHEARLIPLDGRPHVAADIRSYMGDARGRWDGDTLVVETTNFNGLTGSYARNGDGNPTSASLRLVERFRLQDANTLLYQVRVDDPQTWVRPWTVSFPLRRDDNYVIYEYACHEGNYAMQNILSAARAADARRRR